MVDFYQHTDLNLTSLHSEQSAAYWTQRKGRTDEGDEGRASYTEGAAQHMEDQTVDPTMTRAVTL